MTTFVSVITCSHNPREDYLKQVIEALKNQTLDQRNWEYLLIDNASDEPLAARVDLTWHSNSRHVRESNLGLTHARLRGIAEAKGDLLVFVDDDNVLDADYLEQAVFIAANHPNIGAWGGQRRPSFESNPPSYVNRHWSHLALHEFDQDVWSNQPNLNGAMPNGAGLCVRRSVADFYLQLHREGKRAFIMDRTGGSLVSGGDVDLAMCACDTDLGVGLFSALKLTHLIPAERLEKDYLLRLTEGIGYSGIILDSFRPGTNGLIKSRPAKVADYIRYLRLDRGEKEIFQARRKGEVRAKSDLASASRNGIPHTK